MAEWNDERVEQFLGQLLRAGVILAAVVVLAGGALYLVRHHAEPVRLHEFRGEPDELKSPAGVLAFAWTGHARGIIQLGLLLLIATPVARVVCSAAAFALERDGLYVALTLFVLGVLVYSLFFEG